MGDTGLEDEFLVALHVHLTEPVVIDRIDHGFEDEAVFIFFDYFRKKGIAAYIGNQVGLDQGHIVGFGLRGIELQVEIIFRAVDGDILEYPQGIGDIDLDTIWPLDAYREAVFQQVMRYPIGGSVLLAGKSSDRQEEENNSFLHIIYFSVVVHGGRDDFSAVPCFFWAKIQVFRTKKLFLLRITTERLEGQHHYIMIQRLSIKNYAIIEALEIDFSSGLTIITGETGAGKSILLGALGLIMGKRADTKALYDAAQKCSIEGTFDVRAYDLQHFFADNDLDYEPVLIVRREISPSGKSRAFVNDTPVNLKVLQQLSASLIDLHQQFDTLDLNEVSFQLKMLDALAGNKDLLGDYLRAYRRYQQFLRKLKQLQEDNQTAANESEFVAFQLNELEEARLQAGEQEELETELNRLNNAEGIKKALGGAFHVLEENEASILGQLEAVQFEIQPFQGVDDKLKAIYERLASVHIELQDLSRELETVADEVEYDPQRIEEVQSRLDQLYRLQKKHHVNSIEELLERQQQLQERAESFDSLDEEIARLEKQIDQQEADLIELAKQLSGRRKSVVPAFEEKIQDRLALLAMPYAQMKIDFRVLKDLGPSGWDEVHFLFAANKGSRLQEIKDVASGGELSRLALVTKSLVASAIPLPTLIFDEIDSGISGDVALKMGHILRQLSDEHQVVCITHSPQIAARADGHLFVYKEVGADRTVTKVRTLELEDRVYAIATMLSQDPPSDSALENARELINIA